MINVYSILVTVLAIYGAVALILKLADLVDERAYKRRLYASTRHTLPRASVRRLRANRIALHERLLNRRAS